MFLEVGNLRNATIRSQRWQRPIGIAATLSNAICKLKRVATGLHRCPCGNLADGSRADRPMQSGNLQTGCCFWKTRSGPAATPSHTNTREQQIRGQAGASSWPAFVNAILHAPSMHACVNPAQSCARPCPDPVGDLWLIAKSSNKPRLYRSLFLHHAAIHRHGRQGDDRRLKHGMRWQTTN